MSGRYAVVDHPPAFAWGEPSRIDDRHWQAGAPLTPSRLKGAGYDAIALCAVEYFDAIGRDRVTIPGVITICVPMIDDEDKVHPGTFEKAHEAAKEVCGILERGHRVLVTCVAGRNRSGLVSALVLMRRRGMTGEQAVAHIQARRNPVLTNERFVNYLRHGAQRDLKVMG